MKAFLLFLLLSGIYIGAAGQSSPILTGRVDGLKEGAKVWIVQTSVQKDSAIVHNGVFRFYSHGLDSGVYSLRLCREYSPTQWMDMYIGAVPTELTATDTLFHGFRIEGPSWADDFTDYTRLLEQNRIGAARTKVSALFRQAVADHTEASDRLAQEQKKQLDSFIHRLQWSWIQVHPASMVSSFILYNELQYTLSPEELDSVLATINGRNNMLYKSMQFDVAAYRATRVGTKAPLFIQHDVTGKPFALRSFRGHYVLIDFWASWCGPCRKENPAILALYRQYKDRGLRIVSVSLDDKKSDWTKAIRDDHLPWTQVSDLKGWNNAVALQYYIHAIPAIFLLGPDGVIIARDLDAAGLAKWLSVLPFRK